MAGRFAILLLLVTGVKHSVTLVTTYPRSAVFWRAVRRSPRGRRAALASRYWGTDSRRASRLLPRDPAPPRPPRGQPYPPPCPGTGGTPFSTTAWRGSPGTTAKKVEGNRGSTRNEPRKPWLRRGSSHWPIQGPNFFHFQAVFGKNLAK